MDSLIVSKIVERLETLPIHMQEQILDMVCTFDPTPHSNILGRKLVSFAGTIADDDLNKMQEAITDGCEQIRTDEW